MNTILPLGIEVQVGTIPGRRVMSFGMETDEWRIPPCPVYVRLVSVEDGGQVVVAHRRDGWPVKTNRFVGEQEALEYVAQSYECDVCVDTRDPIDQLLGGCDDYPSTP